MNIRNVQQVIWNIATLNQSKIDARSRRKIHPEDGADKKGGCDNEPGIGYN